MKKSARKNLALARLVLFTIVLTALGTMFFVMPKQHVSDIEKRKLCKVPDFCWDTLWKGVYFDSLDLYVADNFPFREQFVGTSFWLASKRGFKNDKITFYQTGAVEQQVPQGVDTSGRFNAADTIGRLDYEADKQGGLMICNNKAMEIFGGGSRTAKAYADLVNKYQEVLRGKAQVYSVMIPSSIEFNLSDSYKKITNPQKPNIDAAYSNMSADVRKADVYSLINAHRNEYLYFGSDHHWTGLGAYYGYSAFCKSAGINPVPLTSMTRKCIHKFVGTLYAYTHDNRLRDNPDSVVYYVMPGNYKAYRFGANDPGRKPIYNGLYAEHASGGNSYGVFLGADLPLMRVDTDVKNGKKVVIIKNSYGNPFSTYFVAHYEQVFIVDYRYYNFSLIDLIEENKINDVVLVNGIFSANTDWHMKMMRKILERPQQKVKPAKDAADTLAKKPVLQKPVVAKPQDKKTQAVDKTKPAVKKDDNKTTPSNHPAEKRPEIKPKPDPIPGKDEGPK